MARQRKPRRADRTPAPQRIKLELRDMGHGGKALGFHRGKPVFAPYAIPGETITAEITGGSGGALFARGLRLQAASADRVLPRCPHFGPGRCWGCHWQHIDYPAQLLLKQDVLADQLSRLGGLSDARIEAALQPLIPSDESWRYNHSLRLTRANDEGGWGLPRETGGIQPIDDCHLAHADLLALLDNLRLDYQRAKAITLRRGSDGRLMLILEVDAEADPQLRADLNLSVNLLLPSREPVNLIGDAHSNFTIGGRHIRVTAGSYLRGSLRGIERLAAEVMQAARLTGKQHALDLYCGVGVFSALMAERAALVTAVESYPPAANDADHNLRDFAHIDLIEGGVSDALDAMRESSVGADVAVVDPPNRGLGADVIAGLARLDVKRLVYVSGNPGALARDAKALLAAGFRLRRVQPIDLSPQTYYIDCVATFTR